MSGWLPGDASRAGRRLLTVLGVVAMINAGPDAYSVRAQVSGSQPSEARRMTVTWTAVPIRDVLLGFSAFSGKSIVAGPAVTGLVTASINDEPWDVALAMILATQGLVAVENEHGIIRVDDMGTLDTREAIEPIVTRAYRISFADVAEIQAALTPLLSARGNISVSPGTNSVIVSDIARVHRAIAGVVRAP